MGGAARPKSLLFQTEDGRPDFDAIEFGSLVILYWSGHWQARRGLRCYNLFTGMFLCFFVFSVSLGFVFWIVFIFVRFFLVVVGLIVVKFCCGLVLCGRFSCGFDDLMGFNEQSIQSTNLVIPVFYSLL